VTGELSVEDGPVGNGPAVLFSFGIEKLYGGVAVGSDELELLNPVTGESGVDDGPVERRTLLDLLHDGE